MTKRVNSENATEAVRAQIRGAFPDFVYSGSITPADGKTGEDYDEHEALYRALHGRTWSQIPASFIREKEDGFVLLTEEALVAYLPAWLIEGTADARVGDALIYAFCPDPGNDRQFMDRRIQRMDIMQKEALNAFFVHCLQTNPSRYLKDRAEQALAYIGSFSRA